MRILQPTFQTTMNRCHAAWSSPSMHGCPSHKAHPFHSHMGTTLHTHGRIGWAWAKVPHILQSVPPRPMIVMLEYSVWPRNYEGVPGYPTFTDCLTFESYRLPDDMSGACGINFDQQMWLTRSCHISAKMDRWRSAPQAWPILLHALFCWRCGQETSVPSKLHPLFLAPHNVAIWFYDAICITISSCIALQHCGKWTPGQC